MIKKLGVFGFIFLSLVVLFAFVGVVVAQDDSPTPTISPSSSPVLFDDYGYPVLTTPTFNAPSNGSLEGVFLLIFFIFYMIVELILIIVPFSYVNLIVGILGIAIGADSVLSGSLLPAQPLFSILILVLSVFTIVAVLRK